MGRRQPSRVPPIQAGSRTIGASGCAKLRPDHRTRHPHKQPDRPQTKQLVECRLGAISGGDEGFLGLLDLLLADHRHAGRRRPEPVKNTLGL